MDTGFWNEENTATALKLWTEGKSATAIALEMGGISRNAVIGKMHRMGITERGPAAEKPSVPRVARPVPARQVSKFNSLPRLAAKPVAVKVAPPAPEPVVPQGGAPDVERVRLVDLGRNECKWPMSGEGEHMLFCAGSTETDRSYCRYHSRLSYSAGTRAERLVDSMIKKAVKG